MIHLILGTDDTEKKVFLENHRKEHYPDASFQTFDVFDFNQVDFEQHISSEKLFGEEEGFVLYGLLNNEERRDFFIDLLGDKVISAPIYFFDETAPKSFVEGIKEVFVTTINKEKNEPDFTLFQAVYSRNKKLCWQAYTERVKSEAIEMLHGSILSQVKNMYKVTHLEGTFKDMDFATAGGESAAKRGAKNYSKEEIEVMYRELVLLPTTSRKIGLPLETALERFILERI